MRNDESLPPLDAGDPTTDAEKNIILRNAINEAARNDPTRFATRSFAVLENTGHSLRLINQDDPRKAISIPWDELSALRAIIDIATRNTDTSKAVQAPETPVVARESAAKEIAEWIFKLEKPLTSETDLRVAQDIVAAIITRYLVGTPVARNYDDAYRRACAVLETTGLPVRVGNVVSEDNHRLAHAIAIEFAATPLPERKRELFDAGFAAAPVVATDDYKEEK